MKKISTILMTVALFFVMAIPTFAAYPSTFEPLPDGFENYDYVAYSFTDGDATYNALISFYRVVGNDKYPISPSNNVKILFDETAKTFYIKGYDDNTYGFTFFMPMSDTNPEWFPSTNRTITKESLKISSHTVKEIYSSTTDIYDIWGTDVVFPPTPSIGQILTEEVPVLVVKPMMRTLSILVPCGVGLMALLIFSPILRKVFYQFQIR